jgi:hypothetical protein
MEYYFQERMGYEVQFNIIRDPFFKDGTAVPPWELYKRGFGVAFRQKFYHKEMGIGMLYFSNELRYSNIKHQFNAIDTVTLSMETMFTESATENLYEYSFIFGNRWMRLFGETWNVKTKQSGITIDFFIGVGIGYRDFKKNYMDNSFNDEKFDDLRQSKFAISPRLGVNIGYVF